MFMIDVLIIPLSFGGYQSTDAVQIPIIYVKFKYSQIAHVSRLQCYHYQLFVLLVPIGLITEITKKWSLRNQLLFRKNRHKFFFGTWISLPLWLAQPFRIKKIVVCACNQAVRPYILVKWRSWKNCLRALVGSRPARHPADTETFLTFYVPLRFISDLLFRKWNHVHRKLRLRTRLQFVEIPILLYNYTSKIFTSSLNPLSFIGMLCCK